MRVIVQIWGAQNQEVTRRVGAISRRIASKIAEVLHDGKAAKILPKADTCGALANVGYGPKADMVPPYSMTSSARASSAGGTVRWSLRNLFRCACHALEKRSLELRLRRISLACLRKPSATCVRFCFVETSGDDRARA